MKKIIKHFMKPVEIFETLDDDIGMFLIISICTALILLSLVNKKCVK
ncbi:hypothetical protein [Enterococcus faecalis]|nr:hypothetical protein [Enterococcus faecalis]